ncbi:hypothetical protein O9993_20920 [Vibrio lentus]|nr:hypothetical protein [Vibrio lentus]
MGEKFPDSSKMFIGANTDVAMMDLYVMIIQSYRCQCCDCEHVAGLGQDAFVDLMNSQNPL